MRLAETARVGYVLKMYPRFSETFVVREILAHEAAGLELELFSLRPPTDGLFHEALAHVRSPVTYVERPEKPADLWQRVRCAGDALPGGWDALAGVRGAEADDVHQALAVAEAACARGLTHLHAHFGSVATSVARHAARLAGIPYSFTAHAKDIFHESVREEDLGAKLAGAAAVVTVSRYNAEHLRSLYGPAAARVHTVYNGLELAEFAYARPDARPARIVAVGRLVEKKGFAVLVEACAILARRRRIVPCDIIGSGPLEADLRAAIARHGLDASVRLLGPRPQHALAEHVQGASVLAAPCVVAGDGNVDGLPTVLLEAMAFGTPCVASDVNGIPELVRHSETGLLVPQHDAGALAEAIELLLDDSALRVRLAANARRLVEEQYDIRRNAARIRGLFAAATAEPLEAVA